MFNAPITEEVAVYTVLAAEGFCQMWDELPDGAPEWMDRGLIGAKL